MKVTKFIALCLYWFFLIYGFLAAKDGNFVMAIFCGLVFASENIAISIDYMPKLRDEEKKELNGN